MEKLRTEGMLTDSLYQSLQSSLSKKQSHLSQRLSGLHVASRPLEQYQLLGLREHLIHVKKARLKEVVEDGLLTEAGMHALIKKLDEELAGYQAGGGIGETDRDPDEPQA